ncbi:MAG: NAD-dependent epimerase/dehydratase family protein [Pseudomonadota bacterium]|jgi:nucleoside-diphosphate-sugar epimerase
MPKRYVITGGGGFVGKALARALVQRGHEVLSLSRGDYPELRQLGIETRCVDLGSDPDSWWQAFTGADGVFHTAAKVDMWGDYEDFFRTNVVGTRNVIRACRDAGVKNLVYTSSPSVIHDGRDLQGIDESYPYPKHADAHYPATKAIAEREVLAVNDGENIRTIALRPHLIWGPGDTNLVPTILERARAGRLTRIGDGNNLIDLTFIDDCVAAHILAMEALSNDNTSALGKAYFISQGEPVPMWSWIDEVLIRNQLPPVSRAIPKTLAYGIASVMEMVARSLRLVGIRYTPLLTRFLVSEMATHHYFSIEAAQRELGYQPSCSIAEALVRTFSLPGAEQAA